MVEQLSLGRSDTGDRAEAFEMCRVGVRDDTDGRLDEPAEIVDLTRMIRAELRNEHLVLGIELHECQRHAEVVVEVAARCANVSPAAQDTDDELLDRRLAVAARHGDDRDTEIAFPGARHLPEGRARIGDLDLRQRRIAEPRDERAIRTVGVRVLDEVVAVEVLAFYRDEQSSRIDATTVDAHGAERGIRPDETAVHLARDCG